MIPRNTTGNQTRAYFTNPLELLQKLHLTPEQMLFSAQAEQDFRFKVPKAYVDRIQPGCPDDPLLRQIFPVQQELEFIPGYNIDPLNETNYLTQPGLLQKYAGRALLLVTPGCAINCRYCFRRHYPYENNGHYWQQIKNNIELIKQEPSITEVILSGGDPLSLSDKHFAELVTMLGEIPHLKRLRIHTRFPVVAPERINDTFIHILAASRLRIIMVLHINHAQEIGPDSRRSISRLHKQQITLLNQSVLLKGVNDDSAILAALSDTLIDNYITPYYLHMLDKIQGGAHFEVKDSDAKEIYQQLSADLPGYMLPRLVREISGAKNKTPVNFSANL